jgi:hydroxymethylbilane synthase
MTHDPNPESSLVIGTRPSMLALWQAKHVKAALAAVGVRCELKKITTKGDKVLDRSLVAIGGKGLFLKEIEDELLAGSIDLAVHSMKDVPYDLPPGLAIAAILPREEPVDAWISRDGSRIEEASAGAVVGTTSLRRQVQLKKRLPHLIFKDLRGNVDTRIKKLDAGEFDGIVLAAAGLKRLGFGSRIAERLDLVSAAGQGAIGIECRVDDVRVVEIAAKLNDAEAMRCVTLERAFLRKVQGSCQTPVGCFVRGVEGKAARFEMRYFIADPDGGNAREERVIGAWDESQSVIDGIS